VCYFVVEDVEVLSTIKQSNKIYIISKNIKFKNIKIYLIFVVLIVRYIL